MRRRIPRRDAMPSTSTGRSCWPPAVRCFSARASRIASGGLPPCLSINRRTSGSVHLPFIIIECPACAERVENISPALTRPGLFPFAPPDAGQHVEFSLSETRLVPEGSQNRRDVGVLDPKFELRGTDEVGYRDVQSIRYPPENLQIGVARSFGFQAYQVALSQASHPCQLGMRQACQSAWLADHRPRGR